MMSALNRIKDKNKQWQSALRHAENSRSMQPCLEYLENKTEFMSIPEMPLLEGYLAKKLLDAACKAVAASLRGLKSKFLSTPDVIENALQKHLIEVQNWASEVTFGDLRESKQISKIFVELDCYVIPRYRRMSTDEKVKQTPVESLFASDTKHFIFLGTPGAGKTTSMKRLCHRILMDETFAVERINYPIVIRLRELNHSDYTPKFILLYELCRVLGMSFEFAEALEGRTQEAIRLRYDALVESICTMLDETKALVILDGFDEISDSKLSGEVLQQIRTLALRLNHATIVLTCRTGEFMAVIESAKIFELCALDSEQIADFAAKWLGSKEKSDTFLEQVIKSPFADNAMKPLTLAHLCAVYERVGSIPEKPKTVYRKILHLLLADWDEQRSVKRKSRYSGFEADRKYEYLSNLAYQLTVYHKSVLFSSKDLTVIYKRICADFDLPSTEANEVTREVESHTGLFVQCGFNEFEFAHKSLQEFLAAEFLVRLPSIPREHKVLEQLGNELAIATSISSNTSLYFTELVFERFQQIKTSVNFLSTYVSRLLQERPDFTSEENVGFALLSLYAMTLEGYNQRGVQAELFLYDRLLSEFEGLLNAVLKTNNLASINSFYRRVGQSRVVSSTTVFLYQKSPTFSELPLPEYLYVPETLLARLGGE